MKKTLLNTIVSSLSLLVLLCTTKAAFASTLDNPVVLDSIVSIQPSCGLDNGRISIYASGSAHIFYSIDNGLTFHEENIFYNMAPGDYSIQVTDGLACILNSSLQLTNGPQVEISNVDITCHEQNVSADILVDIEFGIKPYVFSWEGPSNFSSDQEDLINVTPGEYRITVTDNVGCTALDTIQIPICCGLSQGLELFCPADLYLECGNPDNDQLIMDWLDSATAFDGINNALLVDNNFDLSQTAFCEDIVSIRFSTRDQCDNTTDCSADILIADINTPTIICPADVTLDYVPGGNLANIENWISTAIASDNCTGAFVTHDFNPDDLLIDCQNGSSIDVHFTALDQCQNTDDCFATVTISPAPIVNLICSNSFPLDCDSADPNAEIQEWIDSIMAIDDNGQHVAVENDFEFQSNYTCGEEYNIKFTAYNYCGSTLNCFGKVQIVDNQAPVINCNNDLNISAYANDKLELIEAWLKNVQATDNCSDTELSHNFNPAALNYACGEADHQVVRFEAFDECGNQQVCLVSINIIASEISFSTPEPIQLECGINYDQDVEDWIGQAMATDQFGLAVPLDNDFDKEKLNCSSALEVSFQYQNPCGDLFESTSSILLVDNTGPELICPDPISIQSFELPLFDFDEWINNFSAIDYCSEVFIYNDFDYENFNGSCKENQVVHFVAEDDCGNISECIVDVRISDFAPPEVVCPEDISIETNNPFAKEDLDAHIAKIISNTNSTLSFEYSEELDYENLKNIFQSRVVEVMVTATNECNESVDCSFKIHISAEADIFAPTIFSPNGDGDNDRFTIYGNNHLNTVIKLSIYDRLGNRMQHLTNIPINHPSLGWDGTFRGRECEMGVYAYHALILDHAGNEIEFVGSITLVR